MSVSGMAYTWIVHVSEWYDVTRFQHRHDLHLGCANGLDLPIMMINCQSTAHKSLLLIAKIFSFSHFLTFRHNRLSTFVNHFFVNF